MSARNRTAEHNARVASGLAAHQRRIEPKPVRAPSTPGQWAQLLLGATIFILLLGMSMQLSSISVSLRSIAVNYGATVLRKPNPAPVERRATPPAAKNL